MLGKRIGNHYNPTDLNTYINNHLVSLYYTNSTWFDSVLLYNGKKHEPEITVTNDDDFYQQEFLIAREIGALIWLYHYLPDEQMPKWATNKIKHNQGIMDTYYFDEYSKQEPIDERYINEFAYDFLLPIKAIKNVINHASPIDKTDFSLIELNNRFNVSRKLILNRINQLQLI